MEGILVPIVLFICIFTMVIMTSYFKNRRIERTSLIAAGKEANIFNQGDKKVFISYALKFGILFIGVGLGLLIGDYLAKTTNIEEVVAYMSPVFVLGGISLLIFYWLQSKISENKKGNIL